MELTVLLVIALLVLLLSVLFAFVGEKSPQRWAVLMILIGVYLVLQQLPAGKH